MSSKPQWQPKQAPFFVQQPPLRPAAIDGPRTAGLMRRAIAHFIDAIIALMLSGIASQVLVSAAGARLRPAIAIVSSALAIGISIATVRLSSTVRATYGKAVMGLEVVRVDGGQLSLPQAFLHAALASISLIVWPLAVLLVLARPDRRGLHELVAGTVTRRRHADAPMIVTPAPSQPADADHAENLVRARAAAAPPQQPRSLPIPPALQRRPAVEPTGAPAVQRRKR